jgi:hypothetical protein
VGGSDLRNAKVMTWKEEGIASGCDARTRSGDQIGKRSAGRRHYPRRDGGHRTPRGRYGMVAQSAHDVGAERGRSGDRAPRLPGD